MTDEQRRQEIIRLAERIPDLAREAFDYCEDVSHTLALRWLILETLWRIGQRLRLPWALRRHSPLSLLCEKIGTITMLSNCIVVLADPERDDLSDCAEVLE